MTSNTGTSARPRMAHAPSSNMKVSPFGQAIMAILIGVALLALLVALLPGVYSRVYDERIFPGVAVGGVDVSGMSTQQAAALLAQRLDYPQRGKIVFQEGTNLWTAKPADLGLVLDTQTTALAAYNLGRTGSLSVRLADQWRAQGESLESMLQTLREVREEYASKG